MPLTLIGERCYTRLKAFAYRELARHFSARKMKEGGREIGKGRRGRGGKEEGGGEGEGKG